MRRKLFSLFLAVLLFVQSFAFAEDYYVGNLNTGKFHYGWCSSVDRMKEKNKVYITYNEAINGGYQACKKCNPSGNYTASYQVTSAPVVQKTAKTQPKTNKADVATKTLNFDGKTAKVNTIIQNGSSLMEVRSFVNAMGFILASENGAVSVTGYDGKVLYLYPNSTKVRRWNGVAGSSEELVSPVKTQVIGGRTYVPVRFLVENLGYSVAYDGNAYTVQGAKKSDYVQEISNNPPAQQEKGINYVYQKFVYKNNKLDIRMIIDDDKNILIDASRVAMLCGLHTDIKTLENGKKYILVDNYDSVGFYDKNSRMIGFDEGSNKYALLVGDSRGEFEWKTSYTEALLIGDSFFVPAVDFFVGIGIDPEYTDAGTILTDVRF